MDNVHELDELSATIATEEKNIIVTLEKLEKVDRLYGAGYRHVHRLKQEGKTLREILAHPAFYLS